MPDLFRPPYAKKSVLGCPWRRKRDGKILRINASGRWDEATSSRRTGENGTGKKKKLEKKRESQ